MTDAYVTFIEGKKIKIPDRLLKEIGIRDDERILAVITKRRRMIRLIPTGPDVLKISLTMKELPQTIAAVAAVLAEADLETIYSTGMCYKEGHCIWEGYVDITDCDIPLDDLKERLQFIDGLTEVVFNRIASEGSPQ